MAVKIETKPIAQPLLSKTITLNAPKKKPVISLTKDEKKAIKQRIAEINGIYNEKSTQNTIPYSEMTNDGICVVPKTYFGISERKNYYSKTLTFSDINYQLADDESQSNIFQAYSEILNYFEDSVHFQLTFENRKRDNENLVKKIVIPEQNDGFDEIRAEYSDMIKSKLTEGDNGNELLKLLTFGTFGGNINEVRSKLNAIGAELINLFKKAKIEAKMLNGKERLAVLYRALNPYRRNKFLFDWEYARKIGSSTKDYIAPSSMNFNNKQNFELGDCYGSIMSVNLIASELKDRILYDFLNENQLLCINIHVKPYDILGGQKAIKNAFMNVRSMKSDKMSKNYQSGNDPNDLPIGMQETIDELDTLLKDLKSKDEKLFLITLTIRTYEHSKKKMKLNCDTLRRICQANSCILIPCDYQQEDGFCASLPLGINRVLNKRILHTSSLAVFMPFTSKEIFHIESKRFSYYGLNALTRNLIFADKLFLKNPNTLILGTPGSGKSFTVKREILDVFLKTLDDIFICDPEGEYFLLVNELQGQTVKLSATSSDFLNPMDIIWDKEIRQKVDPIPDKINFILSLMELIVGDLTASEKSLIDRFSKKIYEKFFNNMPTFENSAEKIYKYCTKETENYLPFEHWKEIMLQSDNKDFIDKMLKYYTDIYVAEKMPILEDLYNELVICGESAEVLATSLEMYVYGSQNFFNHRSNVNVNNRIVCFDIKNLVASLKKIGMLIVQETVWNKVSINRDDNKTTRFYIDEFHLLLKTPQTAIYSAEIWKRFRKWGGIPCGITQNVKDLLTSEQIENIFDNTEFYYLLNQSAGDREILQNKLKISDMQAEYITNSEAGCGLIKFSDVILPFEDKFPKDTKMYKLMSTRLAEFNG
jgi:type IV secretory pathway VirB4 component